MTSLRNIFKQNRHDIYAFFAVVIALSFLMSIFCYVAYQKGLDDCQSSCRGIKAEIEELHDNAYRLAFGASKAKANLESDLKYCKEIGKDINRNGQDIDSCLDCHIRH